ncbi:MULTISPECIES: sugar transferase [Calothrix]|uniref:Sugar transferase n=2 Tax=Calothrix TaxID=1186 RepID=A0ABR8AEP6_9CYAN|nr:MULTISPECIES: sugar transferase [Calothrix]MBD2197813.1 sugar transferase [Calothrix parietina FACHB-288]MBD2226217.1 sugar transferase [Calothrix anomala FACHB-343]
MFNVPFNCDRGSIQFHKIPRFTPVLLLVADVFGLFIFLKITFWLRIGQPVGFDTVVCGFILLVLAGLYLADTYHPDTQIAGLRAPARIVISNSIIAGITSALIYLSGTWGQYPFLGRGILLVSLGIFTIWAVISRLLAVKWLRSHAEQSLWLMLGAGESGIKFAQMFLEQNPLGRLVVLAETSKDITELAKTGSNLSYGGSIKDLTALSQYPWSGLVVATQMSFSETQVEQLMQLRLQGIPIYRLPDICETLWYKLPSCLLEDSWWAFSSGFNLVSSGISLKLKRLVDLILAGLLLILLFPLMLLAMVAIKLDSPGSVFYSQLRTGLYGKPFRVYKFRSMYKDAEKWGAQWASQRDPRITRVGYLLRVLRIDELPQIFNVIRGDMSLIGPRPERPEFDVKLKESIPYYELRYLVKPGITGWAQVLYPYGASVEDASEKLAYDLYYIKNYSLWLDIAIAFKTIRVVLLGKGR